MHLSWSLVSLAAVPLVAAGMYREPVVNLDARSFSKVMANEHAAMVAFVAPWCGHCKNLGPEYTAAAQSLAPLIPFYAVDCDASDNKAICAQYGIQGFPTIKAFPKAGKGAARDYNGERKRGALVEAAKNLVPERVRKLRVDDGGVGGALDRFLNEKSTLPHALLVHPTAPSIPFLWKVLGHRLTGKAQLGYIRDTPTHEVLSAVGVDSGSEPRLLFWQAGADTGSVVEYDGELKFNSLLEWLESALGGDVPASEDKPKRATTSKDDPTEATTKATEESEQPKAATADKEDLAARRARLQAKMDEAERRDRVRREKLEAKRKAEAEAATPADAPAAQPEEDAEEEDAPLDIKVEPEHEPEEAAPVESETGTPVDAPAAEAEDFEEDDDEDEDDAVNNASAEKQHERDEL